MRIFVTGGLGYIGLALIFDIVARDGDAQIYVFDCDNLIRESFVRGLKQVLFMKGDIRDYSRLRECVSYSHPDVVYHLAAIHFVPTCNSDPGLTFEVNVQGTQNVVRAANAVSTGQIKKIVFSSSAAVYSDVAKSILDEASATGGLDIYGQSKTQAEHVLRDESNVPYSIARIFNVYGGTDPHPHFIPEVVRQFKEGQTELTLGTTSNARDYVFISDVIDALQLLAHGSGQSADPACNVGTGYSTTGHRIIEFVQEITSTKVQIREAANRTRKIDRLNLVADNRKMAAEYNWRPKTKLPEGLRSLFASIDS